jgi:hypothetical protein
VMYSSSVLIPHSSNTSLDFGYSTPARSLSARADHHDPHVRVGARGECCLLVP